MKQRSGKTAGQIQRFEPFFFFPSARISLSPGQRKGIAHILGTLLADEYILLAKTHNARWRAKEQDHRGLHIFFDAQYDQLACIVDRLAQRMRGLGALTPSTLEGFLRATRIDEDPAPLDGDITISNLLSNHTSLTGIALNDGQVCEDHFNDADSYHLLMEITEEHKKMAWMLQSLMHQREYEHVL